MQKHPLLSLVTLTSAYGGSRTALAKPYGAPRRRPAPGWCGLGDRGFPICRRKAATRPIIGALFS